MEKGVTDEVRKVIEMIVNVDLSRLLPVVSWIIRKKLILKIKIPFINWEDSTKIHTRK